MKNYQEQAGRTMAELGDIKWDMSHMVIGLTSEINELMDAIDNLDMVNIGEEIADKYWYLANYCTMRNYDLNDYRFQSVIMTATSAEITDHILGLTYHISKLNDYVKKFMAYGKPINTTEEKIQLGHIVYSLEVICHIYNIDITRILENNINKLKVRYPGKFNSENAISRDLETEYKELEK